MPGLIFRGAFTPMVNPAGPQLPRSHNSSPRSPSYSSTHFPAFSILPALRSTRKLRCDPRESVQRQLAIIRARIHGSNEFRDAYVPERHHPVLYQHDHHGHVWTRESVSHRRKGALSEDIQAAVTFAVQQNLKLVVGNTG